MKKPALILIILAAIFIIPQSAIRNPQLSEAFMGKTNFAFGTLASSIPNAAGAGSTFTVTNDVHASSFPTATFYVTVYSQSCDMADTCAAREILLISSRTGTTFTIGGRNQESTTHSGAWAVYSKVDHAVTAGTFTDIEDTVSAHTSTTSAHGASGAVLGRTTADSLYSALGHTQAFSTITSKPTFSCATGTIGKLDLEAETYTCVTPTATASSQRVDIANYASIYAADAAAISQGRGLICASTTTLASSGTITSSVYADDGCLISCGTNTLTFSAFSASRDFRIFDDTCTTGKILGLRYSTPVFWGADTTGVSDATNQSLAAVAALNTGKSSVLRFPSGTTTICSTLFPVSGTSVKGEDRSKSVIALANNCNVNGIVTTGTNTQITISDLTLYGNKTNQSAGSALIAYLGSDIHVERVNAVDWYNNGLSIQTSKNSSISDSFVSNAGNHCISTSDTSTTLIISRNTVTGCGSSGINVSQTTNATVMGNLVSIPANTSGYAGIRTSNGTNHVTVEGNVIYGNTRGLFCVSSSHSNAFVGNVIENTAYQGIFIQCDNILVSNNIINSVGLSGSYKKGIQIDGGKHNVVNSNRINNSTALTFGIEESSTADYNTIIGNIITSGTISVLGTHTVNQHNVLD